MRAPATAWLLGAIVLASCQERRAPSPAEIASRGWHAHELVIAAGEHAPTCATAGAAMQRVLAEHRADFVAAIELERDVDRLRQATDYLEAHAREYADLETRMEALSDRCNDDATVEAAFKLMESP